MPIEAIAASRIARVMARTIANSIAA
jgi:hypothetical protein